MIAMLLHLNVCYKDAYFSKMYFSLWHSQKQYVTITKFYGIHSLGLTYKAGVSFQAWACHCSKTNRETRT